MDKRSLSITFSKDIRKYLDDLSEKLGMNRSAVVTMIINQYRQGTDTADALIKAMNLVEEEKKKEKE